ncbi:unnamed protein product [Thelazia callipaeda]|uniref:BTB domain-containing protein n=1 Tax=Thelazia callipaeda TaxID=103827 RepID=A0A0N5CL67_THECL|nr:unnamed protein product [Thelazia callipaeda]
MKVSNESSENNWLSQATSLRQFEFVVEDKSIFVNAHYLAALSPYFKKICFEEFFSEAKNGRAEIKNEKYDEVIELFPHNLSVLIHFSNLMQIPNLRRKLEQYVEEQFSLKKIKLQIETLLEIIIEALNAFFSSHLMDIFYAKLLEYDSHQIQIVSFFYHFYSFRFL